MKKEIHPKYNKEAKATCVCGAEYTLGSTFDQMKVDICAKCHPFYTGTQKLMDVEGRIDKFNKRYANFSSKITRKKSDEN